MARETWHDLGEGAFALTGGSNIGAIVRDGQALLIDAGLDRDGARKALRPLEERGLNIAAILITHGHADHFGGAAWAARRTQATIYAPPFEATFARHPLLEPLFLNTGAAPFAELTGKFTLARDPIESNQPLLPGRITVGGISVEVIDLPGHAPGQVGVATEMLPEGHHVVYCGDTVFPPSTLDQHPILFCADLDAWLTSLETLSTVESDVFVAGHGEPVTDIKPLIEATKARLEEIRAVTLAALDHPREPYDVLRAVAAHFGVTFTAPQFLLLSLTTINAALTSLQRSQQAEILMEDNHLLWRAT